MYYFIFCLFCQFTSQRSISQAKHYDVNSPTWPSEPSSSSSRIVCLLFVFFVFFEAQGLLLANTGDMISPKACHWSMGAAVQPFNSRSTIEQPRVRPFNHWTAAGASVQLDDSWYFGLALSLRIRSKALTAYEIWHFFYFFLMPKKCRKF